MIMIPKSENRVVAELVAGFFALAAISCLVAAIVLALIAPVSK